MRALCLVVVMLAACKEKPQQKPAPAPDHKTQTTPPPSLPTEQQTPADDAAGAAPVPIKPAGGFTTAEDYEQKAFELMDKFASAFTAAGTDCEKLADNLEVFAHDNKGAFDNTQAFEKENPKAEETLEAKMAEKTKQLMLRVKVSMDKCGKHERVMAALKQLPD